MKLARLFALLAVLCWQLAPAASFAANTAATVQKPVNTGNCASYGTYPNVADSGVGCANNQVTISDGAHGTMQLVPSVFGVPNSAGILNMTSQQPLLFARGAARTATDAVDFDFRRTADYTTGGTAGFVNTAGRFYTLVTADRPSYEWSLLAVMDNNQAGTQGSENVAGYFQSHKRYATAGTWAFTAELQDHVATPTAPSVTLEFDLQAKGGDSNSARVIQDLWGKSDDGAAATIGNGMRFNTDAHTTLTNGLTFQGATISNAAIALGAGQKLCGDGLTCSNYLSQASNQWHFWANGTDVVDMTAFGLSSVALNSTVGGLGIPAGQKVCLDTAATCANYLTDTSGTVNVYASSSLGAAISSLGVTAPALQASGGNIGLPAGNKLCLDTNSTCQNYVTDTSGVLHFFASNTDAAQVSSIGTSALALNATTGGVGLPSGQKICLNTAATCTYYLWLTGSNVQIVTPSGAVAAFTGLSSNLLATTASSLDASGNVAVGSGSKVCLDTLSTCSNYITYNSGAGVMQFFMGGVQVFNVSSGGVLNVLTALKVGITPTGVTCSGINAATFTSNGGVVTHC